MYDNNANKSRYDAHAQVALRVMLESPETRHSGMPDPAALHIARENAVGLEFISHYPDAHAAMAEETARHADFAAALVETSVLLAERDIRHLYIKSHKLYRYYDSNVDVIVPENQWAATMRTLEDAGYHGHVMFKEPDKIMFERPGARVSVHLHPNVTWNGVPYFDEAALWQHATASPEGAWLELAPEYDYLVNLAHNIFENYEISLGDTLYFRRFAAHHTLDVAALEAVAARHGWGRAFRLMHDRVQALVDDWNCAAESGWIRHALLAYPYRLPARDLAVAFGERIADNARRHRVRHAVRELYAYPVFYALKRRHDLPFVP